jgi:NADH dehydrogenase
MDRFDVLILGGGFGGTAAALRLEKRLKGRHEKVLLVARDNFFTFTPLLPEAASGTLEPRHAVIPLRQLLKRTEVIIGEVGDIDLRGRRAKIQDLNGGVREVAFTELILSPGSVPTTFSIPGLLEHAVGFKTLPDAIWLRNRVLRQLEAADASDDRDLRRELLTFTFVGGGYAGVEALAELESLARDALRQYPNLRVRDLRWVLVEAADGLLPGIDRRLATYTERQLRRRDIEVYLSTRMVSCEDGVVRLEPERTPPYRSGTIVWTAGQRPSDVGARLGLPVDARNRIVVDQFMRVHGEQAVWAIGDVAAVPDPLGGVTPATAQHALRQGRIAADNVAAALGAGQPRKFRYKTRGLSVTLGKHQGTTQVRRLLFTGPLAWWMGRTYHLMMLPGWVRRARIVVDWTMALFFPRDVSQLGSLGAPTPLDPPSE